MKILFVTTGLSTGGAEMMLLKLLENIKRTSFLPRVVSLRSGGELVSRIEALDIPVISLDINYGSRFFVGCFRLFLELKQFKPDVVQTWMYHADIIGGVVARLAGFKRVVWGIRNSDLNPRLSKKSTLLVVKMCSFFSKYIPERIVTCSTRAKDVHVQIGYCESKFVVLPNGFDLARFTLKPMAKLSLCSQVEIPESSKLVGLVARYDPQKNHSGFIEAAKCVLASMPDVHFILAGGMVDENNSELKALIQAKGLCRNVHLLGRRDDVPDLMAAFDVLVSSSSYGEAFPNVLGEAMACGVPCAVTDVGDSAEIVNETGYVVPVGDMHGLARCIIRLLNLDPGEKSKLGRQARARVEAKYEIGHVTRLYESLYDELVKVNP